MGTRVMSTDAKRCFGRETVTRDPALSQGFRVSCSRALDRGIETGYTVGVPLNIVTAAARISA